MRRITLAIMGLAICWVSPVSANPLLLAPRGTTLSFGQIRAEAALSPDSDEGRYYWFATGFQQWELNAIRLDDVGGDSETLVGVQWNFLPETFLTPAVSFGARDVGFESAEGIGVYVAATRHLPVGASSFFLKDFAVTAGIGAGGIRGPFFGFSAELPYHLFVEGEYDSEDLNGAVGWQPIKLLRFKAYTIRGEFYYGGELVPLTF